MSLCLVNRVPELNGRHPKWETYLIFNPKDTKMDYAPLSDKEEKIGEAIVTVGWVELTKPNILVDNIVDAAKGEIRCWVFQPNLQAQSTKRLGLVCWSTSMKSVYQNGNQTFGFVTLCLISVLVFGQPVTGLA